MDSVTVNLLSALLVVLFVLVVVLWWLFHSMKRREHSRDFLMKDREEWRKRWKELEAMLAGPSIGWSVAIVEADKLFDRVMKSMAMPGKDFAERLRFLSSTRPAVRAVWPAHLVRNRIVHEESHVLDQRGAKQALKTFKEALEELGIL